MREAPHVFEQLKPHLYKENLYVRNLYITYTKRDYLKSKMRLDASVDAIEIVT